MPDVSNQDGNFLGALQFADSFFPSGSIAFSWGLEALRADGEAAGVAQVAQFLEGQLLHRWSCFDAPLVVAAVRASGKLDRLVDLDDLAESMTLVTELREGSRRAGASLLKVHSELGTPGAADYRRRVAQQEARGHLPVMQGMLWQATGLSEEACRAMSAHTLCTGIVGAALRLGMIGHLDAQKIMMQVRPMLVELLGLPSAEIEALCAFTPHAEIASMRHEIQDSRLFAN